MKLETVGADRLPSDVDQMSVVTEHDHLIVLSSGREHPEERSGSRVVSRDQQVVADDWQRSCTGPALDRAETKRQI